MYWMQKRTWTLDSANSHKTWLGALTWWTTLQGLPQPPRHHAHPDYKLFYDCLKRSSRRKTKAKQPILAQHIWRYIRGQLEIDPSNLHEARYDNLVKALALVLIFLTMSRCMEILYCDKTEDASIREIITGIRWGDLRFHKRKGFRTDEILDITVRWFKNQEDHRAPKRIRIASPCCGHSADECVCAYFDIFAYIKEIHRMRRNRLTNIKPFRKSGKGSLGINQAKNLPVGDDDFLFVNARGTICKYAFIHALVKDVVTYNDIDTTDRQMTPHSLRVGGTSLAHHQGIDPLKVMRYVEWRPSATPTMHAHYVRYTEASLANIPYEMLHGTLRYGEPTRNYIRSKPETFELRSEVIRAELYSGPNSNGLQRRELPSKVRPVYDADPTTALDATLREQ